MALPRVTLAPPPMVALGLAPARSFDAASKRVVEYLRTTIPMGAWAVTRVVDDRQITLLTDSPAYGGKAGDEVPWSATMCRSMVAGTGPQVAPDIWDVPAYAAVAADAPVPVGSYVGIPIVRADGTLFGTVCGYDPETRPRSLYAVQPLLDLLSGMLSAVLDADLAATMTTRALEMSQREADTDALTGVLNRRGWDRYLAQEEDRYQRFGDQACVVVLDLDGLKEVNDTRGHAAGDRYIRLAADVLRDTVRPGDVLARLGGDEFGVVVVGANAAMAAEVAGRLEAALDEAGAAGSSGYAPYGVGTGFVGAWREADTAMYASKRRRHEARELSEAGPA